MGILRAPLFETTKRRGFVNFIQNQFVGNSLIQLLKAIQRFGILTTDEIVYFLKKTNE